MVEDGERLLTPRSKPTAPPRRNPEKKIKIARSDVHGLIRGARVHFENGRPVDEGAYLKPYKKLLLDVTSSQACLERTLDLANDLYNAFESIGHRMVIAPHDAELRRGSIDEREVPAKQRDHWGYTGIWSTTWHW